MRRTALITLLLSGLAAAQPEPITIRMMAVNQGIPAPESTRPVDLARRAVFDEFHRQNPDLRVVNAGGLELIGGLAESGFLMSMAGDTAPDVFYVNLRQYYNYIDQGFCRPLDDLIAGDPAIAEQVHPELREALLGYDGRWYAMPYFQVASALYFRKDHFLEAGLDPSQPPRTWAEFYEYGQRLTETAPGRHGFVFEAGLQGKAYHWTNFVWQAGGEIIEEAPGGGRRAAFDSPEAAVALDFFRKMTTQTWIGEDGETYGPMAKVSSTRLQDINEGRISMWFSYSDDTTLSTSDLNPALVGIAAMAAGPAGRANEINCGMWAINASITDPKKLEACWRFIKFFAGREAAEVKTHKFVDIGMANLLNPALLEEFGYEALVATVDPEYVEANRDLFRTGHPEPHGRNTQQIYTVLDRALDRAMLEETPSIEILRDVAEEMDRKLLGFTPPEEMARKRGWAAGILIVFGALAIWALVAWFLRARKRMERYDENVAAGTSRWRVYRFMAICLLPAAGLILIWSYYPLAHGLVIAFQDYKILKPDTWVGLDNFIAVTTQPIFWRSIYNSFLFVGLTIVIGFLIPILLAIALHEIPRGKVLLRTLFFLPAMTSPIVVAFLWKQLYDASPNGFLNTLMAPVIGVFNSAVGLVGVAPIPLYQDWLGNPDLAMFAVVLPGIWAGAGPGSILYLAALKNVPEERYEAADIDGAAWWQKIRYITMPGLRPLILINLLGVFIAGFKAMENIFVLTGGGPLYATHTVGLEVWTNAFMFLKFGYATAAAWIMGAILIGFTLVQIKSLTRMKFTTAKV